MLACNIIQVAQRIPIKFWGPKVEQSYHWVIGNGISDTASVKIMVKLHISQSRLVPFRNYKKFQGFPNTKKKTKILIFDLIFF